MHIERLKQHVHECDDVKMFSEKTVENAARRVCCGWQKGASKKNIQHV